MHGKVVAVRPQALQRRKENRTATALDSEQNAIQRKDIVKVINDFDVLEPLFHSYEFEI